MKYAATAPLLVSIAAVASAQQQQQQQRNLASLAQKWNLTEPTSAYDGKTFSLMFPVTDFVIKGQAKYSLWTSPGCQTGGGTSLDISTIFSAKALVPNAALINGTQDDSGVFSGRVAQIDVTFDSQQITSQDAIDAGIYAQEVLNNQQTATIKFCVRFGLWTTIAMGVETPVEVNFLEVLLTLTVDLTDGFQIGAVETEPKDRLVRTANQAYEVNGYECTADSTDRLTETERTRRRNQGEIIHVCVTPEEEAQTDGVFMRSIDYFAWTRGADIRQAAIEANTEAGNLLTSYDYTACEGSLVCKFSTILFAQFYATPGPVNGEGVASMQFGDAKTGLTRRQLRADRNLQDEQQGAGAAEFAVDFEVNQAEARTESGAGSLSMGFASIAALAAATML